MDTGINKAEADPNQIRPPDRPRVTEQLTVRAAYLVLPLIGRVRATYLAEEKTMFLVLFAVLLVMWLLGFAAFHVAGGLIHILLLIAVISLVMHFVRGRSIAS